MSVCCVYVGVGGSVHAVCVSVVGVFRVCVCVLGVGCVGGVHVMCVLCVCVGGCVCYVCSMYVGGGSV